MSAPGSDLPDRYHPSAGAADLTGSAGAASPGSPAPPSQDDGAADSLPRSGAEKIALLLGLAALVAALAVAVEILYQDWWFRIEIDVYGLVGSVRDMTDSPAGAGVQLGVRGLLTFPFSVPGGLVLLGLLQLNSRTPGIGLVAALGAIVPLAYTSTGERSALSAEMTSSASVLRPVLLVLLLGAGLAAVAAGRRGPQARPVPVLLGVAAVVYLVVSSATTLARMALVASILESPELSDPVDLEIGPWLAIGERYGFDRGVPMWPGLALLLVLLCCSLLSLVLFLRRSWGKFLVSGLGAAGIFLACHVVVWMVSRDAPDPLWAETYEESLVLLLLLPVVLTGMILATASHSTRQWFAEEADDGEDGKSSEGKPPEGPQPAPALT